MKQTHNVLGSYTLLHVSKSPKYVSKLISFDLSTVITSLETFFSKHSLSIGHSFSVSFWKLVLLELVTVGRFLRFSISKVPFFSCSVLSPYTASSKSMALNDHSPVEKSQMFTPRVEFFLEHQAHLAPPSALFIFCKTFRLMLHVLRTAPLHYLIDPSRFCFKILTFDYF